MPGRVLSGGYGKFQQFSLLPEDTFFSYIQMGGRVSKEILQYFICLDMKGEKIIGNCTISRKKFHQA